MHVSNPEGSFEPLLAHGGQHKLKESTVMYGGQDVEKNIKSGSAVQYKTFFFQFCPPPLLSRCRAARSK